MANKKSLLVFCDGTGMDGLLSGQCMLYCPPGSRADFLS